MISTRSVPLVKALKYMRDIYVSYTLSLVTHSHHGIFLIYKEADMNCRPFIAKLYCVIQ